MRTLCFPAMIVDGFYKNPNQVRELALSLPFHKDVKNIASLGYVKEILEEIRR